MRHLARLLGLLLAVGIAVAVIVSVLHINIGWPSEQTIGVVFCLVTLLLATHEFATADSALLRPSAFLGVFYVLYFVAPFLALAFAGLLPVHSLEIGALTLTGYAVFVVTSRVALGSASRVVLVSVRPDQRAALLAVCGLATAAILYAFLWRIRNNQFFTQAQFYAQEATVSAGLRDVFVTQLQLPVIIALSLYCSYKQSRDRWLLDGYSLGLFAILGLASQTRPAVTALIFWLAARSLFQGPSLSPKERSRRRRFVVMGVALAIAAAFTVQATRAVARRSVADSNNQLIAAVQVLPQLFGVSQDVLSFIALQVLGRSSGGTYFLSEVISGTERVGFMKGRAMQQSAIGIVPRSLWPEKPVVPHPANVIQRGLNLPEDDAPSGPLIMLYAEGGWVAVVVGFAWLGFAIGFLTRLARSKPSVPAWITLAFVWSAAVPLELDVMVGSIASLRSAALFLGTWFALSLVFAPRRTRHTATAV